jgi:hypothetical protein
VKRCTDNGRAKRVWVRSLSDAAWCWVAILDSDTEIDRLNFKGKVGPGGEGYRQIYVGKPGLVAQIVTGPGSINFQAAAVVDLTPAA